MKNSQLHRILALLLFAIALTSIGIWVSTRERLPDRIRIATAVQGGMYHSFAKELKEHLSQRTGRTIELVGTQGTVENRRLLDRGEVDLAILQSACGG
ncbi:MAG: TAXI family TRAP transporter solute-binding subunit [bacterium]